MRLLILLNKMLNLNSKSNNMRSFQCMAFAIIFYCGIGDINASSDVESYLVADDIEQYISFYKSDAKAAIEALLRYTLNDTIMGKQIWYNYTEARGMNLYERNYNGVDFIYASLKIKAYYWILRIYKSDYSKIDENICVFISDDNMLVLDYEIIDQQRANEQLRNYLDRVLEGNKDSSVSKYPDIYYVKSSSSDILKLQTEFKKWFCTMEEKGLDYMRIHDIPPIKESRYKIFKPKRP